MRQKQSPTELWRSLLSSEKYSASAMRWVFIVTCVLLNASLWTTWVFVSIKNAALSDIPNGVYLAYWGALTVVTSGKVIQSFSEKKEEDKEGTVVSGAPPQP